jgi:hypothetical protein
MEKIIIMSRLKPLCPPDLVDEYQQYQDATADDDDEEGEEYDDYEEEDRDYNNSRN